MLCHLAMFVLLSQHLDFCIKPTYFLFCSFVRSPMVNFMYLQEAESNRLCRRLQLKDIIPVEMLRLTKYPLLLDNIVKYTGVIVLP